MLGPLLNVLNRVTLRLWSLALVKFVDYLRRVAIGLKSFSLVLSHLQLAFGERCVIFLVLVVKAWHLAGNLCVAVEPRVEVHFVQVALDLAHHGVFLESGVGLELVVEHLLVLEPLFLESGFLASSRVLFFPGFLGLQHSFLLL